MATLIAKQLHKRFGGVHAVSNATFEILDEQVTAIIGPNGAGKSTLVNLLTGFLRPDSGLIRYDGRSLIGKEPHAIARLGLSRTFQDLRLIREMTVRENLLLAGADAAHILAHLDKLGLAEEVNAYAADLSYGQQKLLSIACCLAAGARHLLLDEPVAGVHPDLVEQVADVIRGLQREGRTIVVIEHDLDFVKSISNCVLVMAEGAIIAAGTASEVLSLRRVVDAYLQ